MPIINQLPHSLGNHNYLEKYAKNVTSQSGEDGIIEQIFTILPHAPIPYCVEFGAWDGKLYSNTWNLLKNCQWNGLLVEGDPLRFQDLVREYGACPNVSCHNQWLSLEGENSLSVLLDKAKVKTDFDFLSIDIDGADYYVWESLENYRPKLVVIEFNMTVPNNILFIQDKDMKINQGCSLSALIALGKSKKYELVATTDWNAFFVDEKYFPLFNIADNSIDRMYNNTAYLTHLFQLFDGTLMVEGCKKLLWHNINIDAEKLQLLPKELRYFPG